MNDTVASPDSPTKKRRNRRGSGYLYRHGSTWWVQYFVRGKRVRENTHRTRRAEASDYLKSRLGREAEGAPLPPKLDQILYTEVAADLRLHYKTTGRREAKDVEKRLRPLDGFFKEKRVAEIDEALIDRYVEERQASTTKRGGPPASGTINRELSVLGTMLRLAERRQKLLHRPPITLLKEAPPRAGFFERERYEAVRRHLRPDLQLICDLGYTYGFRVRDEVLTLQRTQVDLAEGSIRLNVGATKSGDGRVIYLTSELRAALTAHLARVDDLGRTIGRIIPDVFPHFTDGLRNPKTGQPHYRAGDRIKTFRRAWRTACRNAGCDGMLLHDLRRTAARDLVNVGVPERVAMTITGHKTRSVFDRYHIVSPGDLKAATARIELSHTDSHKTGNGVAQVVRIRGKQRRAGASS
jgi:integrase